MRLRTILLAGTSVGMLALAPLGASGQDAQLMTAYDAYVAATAGGDAEARANAEAAFRAECERLGITSIEECIAMIGESAGASTEPADEPTQGEPANTSSSTDPGTTDEGSTSTEAAQPGEAAEPAETAQPAETTQPAEATQPAETAEPAEAAEPAETTSTQEEPASTGTGDAAPGTTAAQPGAPDAELLAAYRAYAEARAAGEEGALQVAEADLVNECRRLGYPDIESCIAAIEATGEVTAPAEAQPTEDAVVDDRQPSDMAPVTDSAKEAQPSSEDASAEAATGEAAPPQSDAEAQAAVEVSTEEIQAVETETGERLETAPEVTAPEGATVVQRHDDGVIVRLDFGIYFYDPYVDRDRFGRNAEVYYEELSNGRYREVVERDDGSQVITIYNRYGDILRRVRITADGRRQVLIYADRDADYDFWRDPAEDLPPLRLTIPIEEYVLQSDEADAAEIALFLDRPPVEQVRQLYTVSEVKRSARLRDVMPRVEVPDVTFASGSAQISADQAGSLALVGDAMLDLLDEDPTEIFLIEGHTDAVGSEESNLVLSNRRAETVAELLSERFDIPPENLVTQGYGERYLKVETEAAERRNRRVTIRRITPLVAPVRG